MPSTREEKEQYEKEGVVIKPSSSVRYQDPCYSESVKSLDCLAQNRYNKGACLRYFENYVTCRRFWTEIIHERRANNIEPEIPPPEERDEIRKARFKMKSEN